MKKFFDKYFMKIILVLVLMLILFKRELKNMIMKFCDCNLVKKIISLWKVLYFWKSFEISILMYKFLNLVIE